MPNFLKILGSLLSPLDWCDLLELFWGGKEENISCSPVEALYADMRCSSLHLKFHRDNFQMVAFLEASLTCQRDAYRSETIYSGNLK